jgi:CRISPR-associated protein Csb1
MILDDRTGVVRGRLCCAGVPNLRNLMPTNVKPLTLDQLKQAVHGAAAAARLRVKLQSAGGAGTKVFPPTYAGGVYATEKRLIDGQPVECVLLDSVQSQANRLEQALLQAYRAGKMKFPLIAVKFPPEVPGVGDDNEVTTLDAPHRIFDAILRDSERDKKPFRAQLKAGGARDKSKISSEGESIALANARYASPLLELCPTALVFGAWDSTGAAGGLGNKFARAIVSEIVGVNAVYGVRTASRLDPLGITGGKIYADANGDWTVNEVKDEKGEKEVLFARKDGSKDKGKPSEINHSNVTPDIVRYDDANANTPDIMRGAQVSVSYNLNTEDGEVSQRGHFRTAETSIRKGDIRPGGVTVAYAEQTTVLSLAALRRLRFPVKPGEASNSDADLAARTVLAALALAAVAHQMDPPDYFLRSNCQLVLDSDPVFELVITTSNTQPFTLPADAADKLFAEAVAEMKKHHLPWREEKIVLTPKKALVDLVTRSRQLGREE